MYAIAGLLKNSDVKIYNLFNQKMRCTLLNILMRGITHLGSVTFTIVCPIVLLIIPQQEIKNIGIDMLFTLLISQGVVHLIKRLVHRPRPYKIIESAIAIKPPSCQYSFPSGHTCAAFTIAFALAISIPSMSILFLFLAFLVGVSRIYLGFHYPSDVIVGFLIAYIILLFYIF